MKKLIHILKSSIAVAALAWLTLGLTNTAQAAGPAPYTTDAHTLHLYHFDDASGSGGTADVGSGSPLINLIDVSGTGPSTLASTAGTGSAGFTGFGNSFHPGPANTDAHMAGGTGTTTVGSYANAANFCGADKSFTLEAIINVSSITAGTPGDSTKCMIIGRDGANGSRGYDLYIDSGKLAFYYYNGSADVIESTTIPTTGTDGWSAANWYHAAVTYDAPSKTIKLYWTKLNGKTTSGADLLSTFVITGNDPTTYGANYFAVGSSARDPKTGGNWDRELPGYVDEARISDIARAASDMIALAAVSNPPDAGTSTVTASPTSVPADGSTISTITVTLRDASTAPVAGKTVTLASSRPGSDTISAASGVSSGAGVVTFTVTSSTSGTSTYTATETDDSVTMTQTPSVIFTGPPTAAQSAVTASPTSVPANGSTTSTITVTLKDVNSNPVSGKTVTLASDRGATDTISAASGVSSAAGVVTFTVKSSTPGSPNFTATDSTDSVTVTQTASVTFTVIPPGDAGLSTVTAAPSPVVANGIATSTITVTLKDSGGNAVSGKTVTLASDRGATDTISAASGPSTLAGVVTFTVKSLTAGSPVFTATDSTDGVTVTQTASVTFTWPPLVASAGSGKSVAPGYPATIGGSPTATGGNGVYSYSWSPSTDLSSDSVANPIASPSVTTTYTVTVTDSAGSAAATASVTVTYVTPNASLISVDFVYDGLGGANGGVSVPCSGDTTLTGTTMKNAVGNIFTGQLGPWNPLDVGGNNVGGVTTAISGFLTNGAGAVTTVKMALGQATGLAATPAGNWHTDWQSTLTGGGGATLRAETTYLYSPLLTADHIAWSFTGLIPNAHYMLTLFGSGTNTFSNVANSVAAIGDTEGDWNWADITADGSGVILGTLTTTGNNVTHGFYGAQIQQLTLSASAGAELDLTPSTSSGAIGGNPTALGGTAPYAYSWSPTTALSDPTAANPTASSRAATTTYTVTVTDSLNATATASVVVTYTAPALVADAGPEVDLSPGTSSGAIGGSPTASGGTPGYTYSWSPGTGLSSTTVANPTASPTVTTTYTVTVTDSASTTATASVIVTYTTASLVLVGVDVVANGSDAVSGDVTGSPFTGQVGLWNALALDNLTTVTLTGLKDGGQNTTGVGFVFDATSVGYHLQVADSPYHPGVVLNADNPERAWVTGEDSPVTFEFTGLIVGSQYSLAIYTSGDPLLTLTINGTAYSNPGTLLSTTATANGSGQIVGVLSCGGSAYDGYAEIAGFQLQGLVQAPAQTTPPDFPVSGFSQPGGVPTFQIPNTISGKTYTLWYTDSLEGTPTWTALTGSGTMVSSGGTIQLSDPTAVGSLPPGRFYKLQVQ